MPLRGSGIQTAVAATSVTIAFPAGSQAGDLAVLFASGTVNTVPSGWTSLYTNTTLVWFIIVCSKVLTSGDISAGSVTISGSVAFDNHAGIAVFVGAGGGVRETEGGVTSGGNSTITNTTTSGVLSTDTAIYWASMRGTPTLPPITPGSGSATTLQSASTANAYSVLADQAMPGGVLGVVNGGTGYTTTSFAAAQVIVEIPAVVNNARSTTFLFA